MPKLLLSPSKGPLNLSLISRLGEGSDPAGLGLDDFDVGDVVACEACARGDEAQSA